MIVLSQRLGLVGLSSFVVFISLTGQASADALQDCERFATAHFKKNGSDVTRVQIERTASPIIDRYDAKVGSQYVSSEVMGFVRLTTPAGIKRQRYLCLHAGDGKGAVYFGLTLE
jgi:hypothetical protein